MTYKHHGTQYYMYHDGGLCRLNSLNPRGTETISKPLPSPTATTAFAATQIFASIYHSGAHRPTLYSSPPRVLMLHITVVGLSCSAPLFFLPLTTADSNTLQPPASKSMLTIALAQRTEASENEHGVGIRLGSVQQTECRPDRRRKPKGRICNELSHAPLFTHDMTAFFFGTSKRDLSQSTLCTHFLLLHSKRQRHSIRC